MDNLAQKTLHFLFIPEASLAVIFLLVFIVMSALGIMLYLRCKRTLIEISLNAEEDFTSQRNKMSSAAYLQKKILRLSADEGRLEGLPNNFVSIGIMATFIGLGVAIQGAADLLSAETPDLTQMTDVLAVIAFKFQTSIWGVAFSLIFQFLIVNRYLSEKQDILDDVTKRLYEIEGLNSRLLLEQQNELLAKNFELLIKNGSDYSDKRTLEAENLLQGVTAVNDRLDEYVGATMEFIRTVKTFTEVAEHFDRTTQKLESLVQESGEHYRNAQDNLTQLHEQMIEEIQRNSEQTITQTERNVEAMRKVFKVSAHDFAERTQLALKDSVDDTYRKYQSAAQAMADKYNVSARELAEQYRQIAQTMATSLSDLASDMAIKHEESLNAMAQQYLAEVKPIREGIDGVKPCLDSLDEYIRRLLVALADGEKNSTEAARQTQLATQNLSNTAENIASAIEKNNRAFNEQILAQSKNLEKLLATLESLSTNLAEQHKAQAEANFTMNQKINTSLEHTAETINANLESLAKNQQAAIKSQSQELQNNSAALLKSLQENQQAAIKSQSQELQNNSAALLKSLQENQQAAIKSQSQELQNNSAALLKSLQENQQAAIKSQSQEFQNNFAALLKSLQENQQAALKNFIEELIAQAQPKDTTIEGNMLWAGGEPRAVD